MPNFALGRRHYTSPLSIAVVVVIALAIAAFLFWRIGFAAAGPPAISYDDLARRTEAYVGQEVTINGEVFEVQEDGIYRMMMINMRRAWSQEGGTIMVVCIECERALVGDKLTFVATVVGREAYTPRWGISTTVPVLMLWE